MSRRVLASASFAAVLSCIALPLFADLIITKSGDQYKGYVVREDEKQIVMMVFDKDGKPVAEMPLKKADIIQHQKDEKNTEAAEGEKSSNAKKPADAKKPTNAKKSTRSKARSSKKKTSSKKDKKKSDKSTKKE